MKFRADITSCENGRDKILSACQCGPNGDIEHQIIIQRGPKEYDVLDDLPGPRISCEELGLDLAPGPVNITFSEGRMTIALFAVENIEVDISRLSKKEQRELHIVAKELFK